MALNEIFMTPLEAEMIDGTNIRYLFGKFAGILKLRADFYSYYDREELTIQNILDKDGASSFIPIAKYAVDITAGYFIGKPCKYYSRITTTVKTMTMMNGAKRTILKDKSLAGADESATKQEQETYMAIYRAILRRNHEDEENMALARDALVHRSAFERVYVVKDEKDGHPDIRFTTVDPKKCVLIRDTSVERNPVAFICREEFNDPFTNTMMEQYELITKERHMFYQFRSEAAQVGGMPHGISPQDAQTPVREFPASDEELNLLKIAGIPIIEYRMPENKCFFEDVIPLINARDALLNNMRNTFKYNDDAILLLTGYMKPQTDAEAEEIRQQITKFKTMYLGEDNKVEWLLKNIPIESFNGYYTMLSSDIFAMLGIKNPVKTSEVYQNITTVRYQNYGMDNTTLGMERVFERSMLEGRARIITTLLNYLNNTEWDWEVLDIAFDRNLPSSRVEEAQFIAQMKGAGVLSDKDILDQVQFVEDSDAAVLRKREQDAEEDEIMVARQAKVYNNSYANRNKDEDVNNDKRLEREDGRLRRIGQDLL